ncbi:MAG: hypothetical protein ACLUDU_03625 [Butyricimonas faecihominis]
MKSLSLYAQGDILTRSKPSRAGEERWRGYTYDLTYMDYNIGVGGRYQLNSTDYIALDLYMDNYEYNKLYTVAQVSKKDTTFRIGDEELTKRQKYYNGNLKGVFKLGSYNKISAGTEYTNDYMKTPETSKNRKRSTLAL